MTEILDSFWVKHKNSLGISFQDKNLDVNPGDYISIQKCVKVKVLGVETFATSDLDYNNRLPRAILVDGFTKEINLRGYFMEVIK